MKTVVTFLFALTFVLGFWPGRERPISAREQGLSMLGAFWGLVVAVVAALSFLLLWPLRKMFKKNAATADADPEEKPAP